MDDVGVDPVLGGRRVLPLLGQPDPRERSDAARNREAYARLAWSPYMHNPKLKTRLHRVSVPTLFLWGTADRVLSETYGRGYCALIPGARFETIERAGHFPHIEQPDEFASRALGFAQAERPAAARSRRA